MDALDIIITVFIISLVIVCCFGCYKCYKCLKYDCDCGIKSCMSSSSSGYTARTTNYPAVQYSANVQNRNIYSQKDDSSDSLSSSEILLGIALNQFQREQARDIALLTKELIEIQERINNSTLQDVINLSIVFLHHIDELQNCIEGLQMLESFRELLKAIRDEIVSALQARRTIRVAIIERNGNQIRGIVAQFQA
ncbi:hypothetical protein TVAG_027200 [Trichomonas vaginalis G3]|uniref:Uncharacterized protein n=1 Tax=Trichomonas vaginalis (strain ATCC PRA-98 / G3) TaxID=412133 RepID=A2F1G5_TRIV3|nr:hypothetical protein TVAGG3_0947810 [Trichomonas vaginalis G3]EAY01252.1 hypothetical protein TVAG_027200 [Trichomonas vaginalis G3]KAI5486993.1 hypothetical protein TVAGG3_0947810 [Trichomonas vaginalis G3]|eukprot:XP_001314067.1 hypothetical protein [Trichomonas vaginalis G3]